VSIAKRILLGATFGAAAFAIAQSSAAAPEPAKTAAKRDAAARPAPAARGARPPLITGFVQPGESRLFPRQMSFPDENGRVGVAFDGEPFDTAAHPFFSRMPNGRACVTCHQPIDGMSLTLPTIRQRWEATKGTDPLFDLSDGANCPDLPRGEAKSHSLLLNRGLFRVALPWPPKRVDGSTVDPEFTLEVVSDPTGCNLSSTYGLASKTPKVSVFRRPRMIGNLRYIEKARLYYNGKTNEPLEIDPLTGKHSSMLIMSDARATSLLAQSMDAADKHMGLANLPRSSAERIIDFVRRVYVGQVQSNVAGPFDRPGVPPALGVKSLVSGEWGVNGNDRNVGVFGFFDAWKSDAPPRTKAAEFRASVVRGYDIFFLKPFWIRDTYGINHFAQMPNPMKQTCAFCHNLQPVGVDNVPGWMDIGINNFPHSGPAPDLPTFKITCTKAVRPHPFLGREIYTHDPGRALISGKCEDVGGLIMQQMRGLSARAPYFNNGSARTLREVVDFYDRRYDIKFTEQEKQDLVNFMSVL